MMNETNEFDNDSKEFELAKGQFQHHTKAGIKKKTVRRNFKKDNVLVKTSVKTLVPVLEHFGCESLEVVNEPKKSNEPKKETIVVMSRKGPIIKEKRPIGKKGVNRRNSNATTNTTVQKQQRKGPNDIKNLNVGYTVTNVDRNLIKKRKINKPDPILTM